MKTRHSSILLAIKTVPVPSIPAVARRCLLLTVAVLNCFALSRVARAQCTSGCDFNQASTFYGYSTLQVDSGKNDSAFGFRALAFFVSGDRNTAIGSGALSGSFDSNGEPNSTGNDNTAIGAQALFSDRAGFYNVASGSQALASNQDGSYNTASGALALNSNGDGGVNVANGYSALEANTHGFYNVAAGGFALGTNTSGSYNVATGANALYYNKGGSNTATGHQALQNNTSGNYNVALGYAAGSKLTTGSNNIVIGANVLGTAGEANVTRIGKTTQNKTFIGGIHGKTVASGVGVIVNSSGQLGTVQSSARYKHDIKPMDKASETILKLKPVTFRYKEELDPDKIPQFGLVAEEVEKINSDLVVRDEDGKVITVRYEAVNAMLLNEFLKEHRRAQEQTAKVAELESRLAEQQKQIESLTAGLQKVQFELTHPVLNVEVNKENPHFNISH